MKILLTALLILCNAVAFAQTKKFRWEDESCLFESTYDAKRFTDAQLKDTYKLSHLDFFPNTVNPVPFKFEDLKKQSVDALDKEYSLRTDALKQLNLVKGEYWEMLRQKQLKELEQTYQLSRATMLGYENPARLKDVKFADACVQKYINPLTNGGDELLAIWREQDVEMRQKHSHPEIVEREFNEQFNSPEKFQYARMDVMAFGWWNCANALIDRDENGEEYAKEFKKLFKRTKTVECDEP